mgnify:CR=1 FL=1
MFVVSHFDPRTHSHLSLKSVKNYHSVNSQISIPYQTIKLVERLSMNFDRKTKG